MTRVPQDPYGLAEPGDMAFDRPYPGVQYI